MPEGKKAEGGSNSAVKKGKHLNRLQRKGKRKRNPRKTRERVREKEKEKEGKKEETKFHVENQMRTMMYATSDIRSTMFCQANNGRFDYFRRFFDC